MRYAAILSALLHISILALMVFVMPSNLMDAPKDKAVAIDIYKISEKDNIPKSVKKATAPKKKKKKKIKKKPPAPPKAVIAKQKPPKTIKKKLSDKSITVPVKDKPKKITKTDDKENEAQKKQKKLSQIKPVERPEPPKPLINMEERYSDIFDSLDDKILKNVSDKKHSSNKEFDSSKEISVTEQTLISSMVGKAIRESYQLNMSSPDFFRISLRVSVNVSKECVISGGKVTEVAGASSKDIENSEIIRVMQAIGKNAQIEGLSEELCSYLSSEGISFKFRPAGDLYTG